MRKSPIYPIILAGLLLLAVSCGKYNTNLNELPSSDTDWLLPLVKGRISFDNLKKLNSSTISFDIPSTDIGFASGIQLNVPGISIPELGPYNQPLSDWIHTVQFDTLEISLSFQNSFPIPIGAGTQFSFRRTGTTADPNNIVYQHTVASDIAPGQPYSFTIDVNNNAVSDTLFLFLEQFSSPGGNNVTFSSTPSKIDVTVDIIDIKKVELNVNKSTIELDTVEVDFGSEETNTGPIDTSSNGNVHFFIDHALPIHMNAQVYFLDPLTSVVTDSLLSAPLNLIGCNTDANGHPLNVNASKTSIYISNQRIQQIRKSKRAVLSFRMNTNGYPGPYVQMSDQTYLNMQITGDLHLSFNLNDL